MTVEKSCAPLLPPAVPATWTTELQVAGALVGGRRNRNTAEAYARHLRQFFDWCVERQRPPFAAGRSDIDAWLREMEATGASTATALARLSAVQQFYELAEDDGLIGRVPTRKVERPCLDREPSLGIDEGQARLLIAVAAEAGAREETIVCLLLLNGLRVGAMCALRVGDLAMRRGEALITVTEKRSKVRRAPLAPQTAAAVQRHIAERGRPGDAEPLVVRADGSEMDRWEVGRITHRLGSRAGIPRGLRNPHELRHTFVTLALAAGVPLDEVQESAGHVDPKTTFDYKRASERLDRHATFRLAEYLERGGDPGRPLPGHTAPESAV